MPPTDQPGLCVPVLAPVGRDGPVTAALLRDHGIDAAVCGGTADACRQIADGAGVLLLTEEALELVGAPGLLAQLRAQPTWSELPLIILTSGGEPRSARLLDLAAQAAGAITLLERPLGAATLLRTIEVALHSRRRQYQVRDLLAAEQRQTAAMRAANTELKAARHAALNLADDAERARQRAEQAAVALRESEQRLGLATNGARIGLFEWDIATNKTLWTEQQARLLGFPAKRGTSTTLSRTYQYRDWARRVHPEDLRRVKAGLHRCMANHTLSETDYRVVWPDKSVHWLASRGVFLYDAKGKPQRMLGMSMDITERKRLEEVLRELSATLEQQVAERTAALTQANEQLRRADARLTFLLGSTAAVINSRKLSANYDMTFISENVHGVLGYEGREFLEKSGFWAKRVHPEDKFQVFSSLARLPVQPVQALEYRFRHKDGTYHWMRDDVRLVKDETGSPQEIVGSWLDISRQRWMEDARRQSERALTDFFAEAPMGLVWVSPEGRILRANRAQAALLGLRVEELFGRQLAEFGADPEITLAMILRLARKELVHHNLVRLCGADGSIRHVLVDANGLWENGKLVHSRWFIRDVTRRVELQKEILAIGERVQRRIGRDLHDDLGQRLTSIQYLSRALEQRLADLNRAEAARAKEIGQLAREAVIYSRDLSHAMTPMELEAEGISQAFETLAARTQKAFPVACEFHCAFPVSVTDSTAQTYLYRIAQEAIHNAVQHGKARRIQISLEADERNMVLSVQDDGVGLPLKPRKRQGFGLRIMEYRASALGGSLVVERRSGGGTSLICSIPKEATQPPSQRAVQSAEREVPSQNPLAPAAAKKH